MGNMTTFKTRLASGLVLACLGMAGVAIAADPEDRPLRDSIAVELGPDRGRNPGSLFEVTNADGRVVAGAGFTGSYNTQPRSDRENLEIDFHRPRRPSD